MIYGATKLNGVHPVLWMAMGYLGVRSTYDWKVTSGVRDSALQASLYAQGRDGDPRPVVTDAPPGTSAHEYGLAIDVYPTVDGGASIVTDYNHPAFAERDMLLKNNAFFAANLDTNVRISSGVDVPHVQLMNWHNMKTWKTQWAIFAGVGVLAILFVVTR